MRLPFQRSKDPAADRGARAGDDTAAVEQARTRARRRLSGALVLLLAGVIGFPLLFETQPRPLPVDTPIEVRSGELSTPPARSQPPAAAVTDGRNAEAAAADGTPSPGASAAVVEAPPPARVATPEPAPVAAAPAAVGPAEIQAAPGAVAETPVPAAPRSDDGGRARALLEGGATAQAASRFVVQAGAYSDPGTLRQARQKVERLGLKTYTQVIETADGKRTRVRIGPYASRAEAEAAAARIKAAGLPASILAL